MTTAGTLTANQRFDAWGNKGASSGTVPTFGYTGREPDATGLTYYRARYYHPGIGRFMSRDPAGMVDAVSPYAYVGNNPVGYVDPHGLFASLSTAGSSAPYYGGLTEEEIVRGLGLGPSGLSTATHGVLTVASFCPSLCGSAFSVVEAGVYAFEGDKAGAGISLAAAGVGIVSDAGAAKLAGKGIKAGVEALEAASAARGVVRISGDALKAARKEFEAVKPKFWRNEASANPGTWSADNLARMKQGKAPIGGDGFPMELHHNKPLAEGGSNAFDNLSPLTRTDHRLGDNYKLNHPNLP